MDYTVCGILQARILEWVAFPFSSRSSQPRDWIQFSCIEGRFSAGKKSACNAGDPGSIPGWGRCCGESLSFQYSWASTCNTEDLSWILWLGQYPGEGKDYTLQYECLRICLHCRRLRFDSWVRKIPWRRAWQPIPVFLPGEFHGQRSLAGYRPLGHNKSDVAKATEHVCIHSAYKLNKQGVNIQHWCILFPFWTLGSDVIL